MGRSIGLALVLGLALSAELAAEDNCITRGPYLQRVGRDSARLHWGTSGAAAVRWELTGPGNPVTSVETSEDGLSHVGEATQLESGAQYSYQLFDDAGNPLLDAAPMFSTAAAPGQTFRAVMIGEHSVKGAQRRAHRGRLATVVLARHWELGRAATRNTERSADAARRAANELRYVPAQTSSTYRSASVSPSNQACACSTSASVSSAYSLVSALRTSGSIAAPSPQT